MKKVHDGTIDMLNIGQFLCYQVQCARHAHARDVYAASARRHATRDRSIKVVRFLHHDAIRNATGLMRKQATLTQRSSYIRYTKKRLSGRLLSVSFDFRSYDTLRWQLSRPIIGITALRAFFNGTKRCSSFKRP